jgi:hypothetical protein
VRTGFDEAIAPGEKSYDFNIQQYSITEERDEVVDFSDGYYQVEQAVVARPTHEIASAHGAVGAAEYQLGAAIGTTSLDYIEDVIQPSSTASVYDDNAAAKAAFDAGQVDGDRLRPAHRLLHHRGGDPRRVDHRRAAPSRRRARGARDAVRGRAARSWRA